MMKAKIFTATEAQDDLLAILKRVARGEPVVIEQQQREGKISFRLELIEAEVVEAMMGKLGSRKGWPCQ